MACNLVCEDGKSSIIKLEEKMAPTECPAGLRPSAKKYRVLDFHVGAASDQLPDLQNSDWWFVSRGS